MGIEEKIKLEDASSTIAVNLNVSRTSFQIEDSPDSYENCQNSSLEADTSKNTVLDPQDTLNQSSLVRLVEKQSIFKWHVESFVHQLAAHLIFVTQI